MECAINCPATIGSESEIDIPQVPLSPLIVDFSHLQGEHQPLGCML